MTALLRLQGVQVTVSGTDRPLLDLEALEVQRGETLAVLGPTGAGKSTLLRVMNGLLPPNRGELFWEGQPVSKPMPLELRRRMTMVFQDPLLFRGSVADNVAYGLGVRGQRDSAARERVHRALKMFCIDHLAERSSARLSGGEAQRVSLARAVVVRADLLLLDEPLASVDAMTRDRLGDELKRVIRSEGMTCVYVTHDQGEAQRMAQRIGVVEGGKVLQVGTPEEIFYRPRTERVARFVQTGNVLEGTIVGAQQGTVEIETSERIIEAVSDLPMGTKVVACLRPEDIVLIKPRGALSESADEQRRGSARNRMVCTVTLLQPQGPITHVTLEGGIRLIAVITRRSTQEMGLEPGDVVEATFKATALHVLEQTEVAPDAASP